MQYRYSRNLAVVLILTSALLITVPLSVWCGNGQDRAADADWASIGSLVKSQENFHLVDPGVWRSAQTNGKSLRKMKAYGLKSVVNLRGEGWLDHREKKFCEKEGLRYFNFPMDSGQKQDPEYLRKILAVIENPENQPVLVHCRRGKDRTGLVIALYSIEKLGRSFDDVRREMLMYGYDEKHFPHLIEMVKEWGKKEA